MELCIHLVDSFLHFYLEKICKIIIFNCNQTAVNVSRSDNTANATNKYYCYN